MVGRRFARLTVPESDANTLGAKGEPLDLRETCAIFFCVTGASGDHDNHVVGLEVSADKVNWFNVDKFDITGIGCVEGSTNARYVRVVVKTVEGAESTIEARVVSK